MSRKVWGRWLGLEFTKLQAWVDIIDRWETKEKGENHKE